MEEGKLMGHIIFERGIKIDLDRVEAIQQIGLPKNKKRDPIIPWQSEFP